MSGLEEDNVTMLELMRETIDAAPGGVIAGTPGAIALVDELYDTIDSINSYGELQSTDISGWAIAKAAKKEVMLDKIDFIAKSGKSLSITIEDEVLEREMRWRKAGLNLLPDTTSANTCKRILDLLEPFLPDLVDYDVTAPVITAARTSVADFRASMSKPRANIVERSYSTQSIGSLIRKALRILKKLDAKMEPLMDSRPAFISTYFGCRKVIRTGTRTLALRGTVKDLDGVPLEKVRIAFEGLRLVKKTTAKGNFQCKHFEPGTYQATCSLPGFEDKEIELYIVDGLRTEVEVVMERVAVLVE